MQLDFQHFLRRTGTAHYHLPWNLFMYKKRHLVCAQKIHTIFKLSIYTTKFEPILPNISEKIQSLCPALF